MAEPRRGEETAVGKGNPPNILLLFTDQQRYDTIAAGGTGTVRGYPYMVTPNLDRLVESGCHFTHAYTPNPVCISARWNLMSGLPARFHGYAANYRLPANQALPLLPQILADNGYETRAVGKMHFHPPRRHNGFNRMELMEEIPDYREDDEYARYLKKVGLGNIQNIHGVRNLLYMLPQRSLIPEEHHGSTWVGDRAVEFLRANRGHRPFFMWASWIAPHPPFDVPDTFADLYVSADIPEPTQAKTPLSFLAQASRQNADLPAASRKELLRRMRELYCSAISLVDKNVGKILDALEESGELDNTLIIFTSDHGEMLGDLGCFQKMLPYDSCARIPFLVRYPERVKPGSVRDEFVDLNDILPTILDVAGIAYPGSYRLPGASIFQDEKDRRLQYMEYGSNWSRWISLRDRRHKYNYYYAGGREELFDLQEDPEEAINLLHLKGDDPAVTRVRDRLKSILYEYEAKWGLENYAARGGFLRLEAPDWTRRRNGQFPLFPAKIVASEEKAMMNAFGDEVIAAVRDEPVVKLHELDLAAWEKNGAPKEVSARIRSEKL